MFTNKVYQYGHRTMRPVYKVALTVDNHHTRREGLYPKNEENSSIETTYLIPVISHHSLDNLAETFYKKQTIRQPIHKKLTLPAKLILQQYGAGNIKSYNGMYS